MMLPSFRTLVTFQVVFISLASAQFFTQLRFQKWFEFHNAAPNISNSACSHTLSLYEEGARIFPHAESTQVLCLNHMECILDTMGSSTQNMFGSALVLLGLTPAILAGVGFTVGEIAYIAVHRPGLSFLLSMGSPVIFSGRVLSYSDPEQAWQNTGSSKLVLNGMNPRFGVVISVLQYILATGSVANIFTLVVEISTRSISTFDCIDYYKPIVWAIVPIFIHLIATVPYLMGGKRSGNLYASPWPQSDLGTHVQVALLGSRKKNSSHLNKSSLQNPVSQSTCARFLWRTKRYIIEEMTICACRPPVSLSSITKVPLWCVGFNTTASLIGLVHIIFGTIVLSSVYFIRVEIAVYCIVRFIISAVICRLILIVEFAGMRGDTK
ncbi:uncharacterized protein K444DRAFT_615073 [Hyaloscypha bicolor E]|uniref:Uncharacterized protein n=1 Tax=Hyaloscypha bicolor E TaxID=1095630 RepID=A0A2J6T3V4_9HELO|nr:uncharacterized protein K444DRAFT_615073 [Hyaloscypha bicolor E]PMD57676.1 hypothetical protein K444DRAFT_615073 [Hyaloscypha bicolor E]